MQILSIVTSILVAISFETATVSSKIIDCTFLDDSQQSIELVCVNSDQMVYRNDCYSTLFTIDSLDKDRYKIDHVKGVGCILNDLHFTAFNQLNATTEFNINYHLNSVFKLMPNIIEMDFSSNELTAINSSDFEDAFKMTTLNISFNRIAFVEFEAFSHLVELKILDLSNNRIESFQQDLFQTNLHLKCLHLTNNPIKYFDCNTFALKTMNTVKVHISWQQIQPIQTNCMNGTVLKIKDQIVFITSKIEFCYIKEHFRNLRKFNISHYALTNAAEILDFLGSFLIELDLSANFLGTIGMNTLKKFQHLRLLDLSATKLITFQFNVLQGLIHLEFLDISDNHLEQLEFDVLPNLRSLNMAKNRLKTLHFNRMQFPALTFLGISGNWICCDYLHRFLLQWEFLYILHNGKAHRSYVKQIDCIIEERIVDRNATKVTATTATATATKTELYSTLTESMHQSSRSTNGTTDVLASYLRFEIMCVLNVILLIIIVVGVFWFCWKKRSKRQRLNLTEATVRYRRREAVLQPINDAENIYDEIRINNVSHQ